MNLLSGYLWKTTGVWEKQDEDGAIYPQVCEVGVEFLVFHEDEGGGSYVLTDYPDPPGLGWGTVEAHIPDEVRIGRDLEVFGADGFAGYTVWVARADGKTNEVTLLTSD